jgi:hypothetical protein
MTTHFFSASREDFRLTKQLVEEEANTAYGTTKKNAGIGTLVVTYMTRVDDCHLVVSRPSRSLKDAANAPRMDAARTLVASHDVCLLENWP